MWSTPTLSLLLPRNRQMLTFNRSNPTFLSQNLGPHRKPVVSLVSKKTIIKRKDSGTVFLPVKESLMEKVKELVLLFTISRKFLKGPLRSSLKDSFRCLKGPILEERSHLNLRQIEALSLMSLNLGQDQPNQLQSSLKIKIQVSASHQKCCKITF